MVKFGKPANLNGTELLAELNAEGVLITEPPMVDGNGDLWLEIDDADESKAKSIVAAHDGTTMPVEPTLAEKLAIVGLSIEELKAALTA